MRHCNNSLSKYTWSDCQLRRVKTAGFYWNFLLTFNHFLPTRYPFFFNLLFLSHPATACTCHGFVTVKTVLIKWRQVYKRRSERGVIARRRTKSQGQSDRPLNFVLSLVQIWAITTLQAQSEALPDCPPPSPRYPSLQSTVFISTIFTLSPLSCVSLKHNCSQAARLSYSTGPWFKPDSHPLTLYWHSSSTQIFTPSAVYKMSLNCWWIPVDVWLINIKIKCEILHFLLCS